MCVKRVPRAVGTRAYANAGIYRGTAGQVRGGAVLAGSGESEGLRAHGGKVDWACEGLHDDGGAAFDGRDVPGFLVGVRCHCCSAVVLL